MGHKEAQLAIIPVRPDLAIIRHFGIILKTLGNFDQVYFVFRKNWSYFGNLIMLLGKFSLL